MGIDLVKVRARIVIEGSGVDVETPFIQSFNVRKVRGQSSTFDASLKVEHTALTSSNTGGYVQIHAGADGNMEKIYTGILKKATISPCWDDPGYVILNINGIDVLSYLQGKKYTRRCRATKYTWVSINGVTREGLRDGKFDGEVQTLTTDSGKVMRTQEYTAAPVYASAQKTSTDPTEIPVIVTASLVTPDEGVPV